jgi:hypothetical protein
LVDSVADREGILWLALLEANERGGWGRGGWIIQEKGVIQPRRVSPLVVIAAERYFQNSNGIWPGLLSLCCAVARNSTQMWPAALLLLSEDDPVA